MSLEYQAGNDPASAGPLANLLKIQVEDYYRGLRVRSPFLQRASQGTVSPYMVAIYVSNLRFLFAQTPEFLKKSIERAHQARLPELATFYQEKWREEQGHDKWAEDDLVHISEMFGVKGELALSCHVKNLVKYLFETIEQDPLLFLSYIFFAEYLTILAGPELLYLLETKCGIPKRMVSAIGNHAELDKDHVDEMIREINNLVDADGYSGKFLEVVEKASSFHEAFCEEVGKTH